MCTVTENGHFRICTVAHISKIDISKMEISEIDDHTEILPFTLACTLIHAIFIICTVHLISCRGHRCRLGSQQYLLRRHTES